MSTKLITINLNLVAWICTSLLKHSTYVTKMEKKTAFVMWWSEDKEKFSTAVLPAKSVTRGVRHYGWIHCIQSPFISSFFSQWEQCHCIADKNLTNSTNFIIFITCRQRIENFGKTEIEWKTSGKIFYMKKPWQNSWEVLLWQDFPADALHDNLIDPLLDLQVF